MNYDVSHKNLTFLSLLLITSFLSFDPDLPPPPLFCALSYLLGVHGNFTVSVVFSVCAMWHQVKRFFPAEAFHCIVGPVLKAHMTNKLILHLCVSVTGGVVTHL